MKALLLVPLVLACRPGLAPEASAAPPALLHPGALERLAVVGASLSDGYQLQHDLARVLDALVVPAHQPPAKSATLFFFANPLQTAPDELELVELDDPSALVAVDFLFWFGYGTVNAQGGAIASEGERLELLETGLELLADLDLPIVVGDFPDMSDSIGLMLTEAQVPEPETLERLNARLRAWAAERTNVAVVPLASTVETLRSGRAFTLAGLSYPERSTQRLLQADQLHPTQEGLVVIARLVGLALASIGAARPDDFRADVEDVLARLADG